MVDLQSRVPFLAEKGLEKLVGATVVLAGVHRKIISAALGPKKGKLNLVGKSTKLWLVGYHYKHIWP